MEKEGWKIIAIIAISLFVLETLIIGGLSIMAFNMIDDEIECVTMCEKDDKCVSYVFDDYTSVCNTKGITDEGIVYTIKSKRIG